MLVEDGSFNTRVGAEIADQPAAWAQAAALATHAELFPHGGRVALIGCGSSWHAADAVADLRETSGAGETDAFAASEARLDRAYDRVVAISRSGRTTEILRALDQVSPETETLALVADPSSPLAERCTRSIDLEFANDRSVVQTRFVTTVVTLARAALGLDVSTAIADAKQAIERPLPAGAEKLERAVVLGCGWCAGLAQAAALVLRETTQLAVEAYPAMEYRHGPIAAADAGTWVWLLGEPPQLLAEEIETAGATVLRSNLDPLAQVVSVQRLAVALARHLGKDPDRPRHLRRAVVLGAMTGASE